MYRLFGWGARRQRLVEAVPFERGVNLSRVGAFDREGMVAITSKLGAMKRVGFEQFLQNDLLPRLLPGSVLVRVQARLRWTRFPGTSWARARSRALGNAGQP